VIRILDPSQRVLGEYGYDGRQVTPRFSHTFDKAGVYYIRVADYENSGRASHFYRVLVGKLPLVVSAYPLGVPRARETQIALTGYNLGAPVAKVKGVPSRPDERNALVRPETPSGPAFNEITLAVGDDAEVQASGANVNLAAAQPLVLPATANGRIAAPANGVPVEHYYRFSAAKGQKVVVEVNARRLGSELDSVVEVLDAQGQPIELAVARATWETSLVLRDHDSAARGLRVQAWNVLNVGDYVLVGNEILRVDEVPDGPDEDLLVESFGGQRRGFFGTTPEAHGVDRPVYKSAIHPPGSKFTPNGLPLVRLHYRNDDGGPGYGKDSLLEFTAPAAGDYLVRLRDVRGLGGDRYAYRLSVREPRPDFRLSVNPRNPNVPAGGTIPVTVTAFRTEGFDGAIDLSLTGLPRGLTAARSTIPAGLDSATVLIAAAADARLAEAVPFEVEGRARIGGRDVVHRANPEDRLQRVALAPNPDIVLAAETREVELEPGQTAEVTVSVRRQNGFRGRVPVIVTDLPARVRVADSGLNGVLITEEEDRRSFTVLALPNAEPVEGTFYVQGRLETRSAQPSAHAAPRAIRIRVKAATRSASAATPTADSSQEGRRAPELGGNTPAPAGTAAGTNPAPRPRRPADGRRSAGPETRP
jgi:hypothetical protein